MGTLARTPGIFRAAAAATLALISVLAPAALPSSINLIPTAAAQCPDAEVVFARGRIEPPGVGAIGDAFVNAFRASTSKSVGVYGVNYAADLDAAVGARDIGAHIRSMASDCPNTRIVVGGYSLGATAADLFARANSLPPAINQKVAAIVLFGNGTRRLGAAPAYSGRWIDQCADGDPICGRGLNWDSHLQPSYLGSGLVEQAASMAAAKL